MDVFVVRKPILDQAGRVFAYQLVRSASGQHCQEESSEGSAGQLVYTSTQVLDHERLAGGKRVFISFTLEALLCECAELFPPESTIVDLHRSVRPTPEVVEAVRRLQGGGYTIAVPWDAEAGSSPLLDLADIVTLDLRTWRGRQERQVRPVGPRGGRPWLALTVETFDDYNLAVDLGCSYFEGSFFMQPVILASRDVPGYKPSYLKLLRALNAPELNFRAMANIIAAEASLSYKLLRLVNSALFGLRVKINAVDRALMMLGERGIRQWAGMLALSELSSDTPTELIVTSAIRARFCQLVGQALGATDRLDDLFLLGLFSLLDVIAHRPLDELLYEMGIDEAVRDALMGRANELRCIYELVVAYEQGQWASVHNLARHLKLDDEQLSAAYVPAVEWARVSLSTF